MKIKLSKSFWSNFYAMIVCFAFLEVTLFHWLLDSSGGKRIIVLSLMLCITFCLGSATLGQGRWKYLMIVTVKDFTIRSFLFGNQKCEVYLDRQIYYAVFKCLVSNSHSEKFIALSNEPFLYEEKKATAWSRNTYIECHDVTQQIILPYNEKTKQLLLNSKKSASQARTSCQGDGSLDTQRVDCQYRAGVINMARRARAKS